ncbi:ISAs1 family transposase [Nostoc sp.]|uniref:ISAs1 family transposase n=1 Tax=Nostoc sp. TaxID=1180 RepID=UPI003FA60C2B
MPIGFENRNCKTNASLVPSIDSFDITSKFQEYFTEIKDPRVERTRWHLLTDIITIAILAVIAAAQGWEEIEEYGVNKQECLETFLELPEGIPSPDTFRRVFERINQKEFEQCFRSWVQSLVEKLIGRRSSC